MSTKWVWTVFMVMSLAACQREQSADTQSPADAPPTNPEKRSARRPATVLAGGYLPSFPHKIRSQRHVAQGAKVRHVVIMEVLETDPAAAIDIVRSELTDRGFNVADPIEQDGRTRLVATKSGLQLVTDISGGEAVKLNDPAARGIAYFTWTDSKRR